MTLAVSNASAACATRDELMSSGELAPSFIQRKRWLQAAFIACSGHGMVVVLASMCFYLLSQKLPGVSGRYFAGDWRKRARTVVGSPRWLLLLVYVGVMTALSSVTAVSWVEATVRVLVGVEGGANADEGGGGGTRGRAPVGLDGKGNFAFVLSTLGADGILVWRCWVIYASSRRCPVWVALAVPVCLYLGLGGLGITFLIPRNLPGSERRVYELAYVASTLALNTIVTGMIATRLMVYRYRTNSVGGPLHSQGEGLQYVGIVAMLIESAALVVMFNAIFLATIPLTSFVYYVAFAGSAQAQVIAPLLITFRVLQGKAWSGETSARSRLTSMRFGVDVGADDASEGEVPSSRRVSSKQGIARQEEDKFGDVLDVTQCDTVAREMRRTSHNVSLTNVESYSLGASSNFGC